MELLEKEIATKVIGDIVKEYGYEEIANLLENSKTISVTQTYGEKINSILKNTVSSILKNYKNKHINVIFLSIESDKKNNHKIKKSIEKTVAKEFEDADIIWIMKHRESKNIMCYAVARKQIKK